MMHPEQILSRKCLSTESAVTHQHHITQIPLGAKLPMVPGNSTTLVTTKLGQRLQKPSCDFDISTPKEIYVSNEYNDLHDPHLINYFKKNKALKNHLEEMGYIDSQGSIICKLNTYNLYRQYLKKLSIDGLNKKYKEQFKSEKETKIKKRTKNIDEKVNDPENPINKRLEQARLRRDQAADFEKGRAVSNISEQDKTYEERIQIRFKEEKHRALKREQLEKDREKRKEVQAFREAAEREKIEEAQMKKHFEDQKRMYEKHKRDRKIAKNRLNRLEDNFIRKEKYRQEKNNQLVLLAAEHELRRQQRVKQWEGYFAHQLHLQEKHLEKVQQERAQEKLDVKRQRLSIKHQRAMERLQQNQPIEETTQSLYDRMFQFSNFQSNSLSQATGDQYQIQNPYSQVSRNRLSQARLSQGQFESQTVCMPKIALSEPSERAESMHSGFTGYSEASSAVQYTMEADFIVKQVLNTVEKGLPTLQNAIEHFEHAHGRHMSDEEVYALIHKLNTDGRRKSMITYDEGTHFFNLSAGKEGGLVRFELEEALMISDPNWHHNAARQRRATGIWDAKGNTVSLDQGHIGSDDDEGSDDSGTIIGEMDEDAEFISQTVKALSHKVVANVMNNCGLEVRPDDVADVAMAFIKEVCGGDSEAVSSLKNSTREGADSRASNLSAISNSTCMHDLADRVIVELLGLEGSSHGTDFFTETDSSGTPIFDNDDLNMMALEIVKHAIKTEHSCSESFQTAVSTDSSEAETAIRDRLHALSSKVVKAAFEARSHNESQQTESLPSQDIKYIENRVENLATRILDNVLPTIKEKTGKNRPDRVNSARSGKSHKSYKSSSGRISSNSTLPDDYEERCNNYTARIIQTLLSMKSIMPHPKPSKERKERMNPAAAIARCINFEELYKAPKEAFQLRPDEVEGLAEALTEKLNYLDTHRSTSAGTSPRDGGIHELTQSLLGGLKIHEMSSSSSSASHGSEFAAMFVKDMVQKGNFTAHDIAMSEGNSSLADDMVDEQMKRAQRFAEDSAESALDTMAKEAHMLADQLLRIESPTKHMDSCSSNTGSSVDGIADRLAGLIVEYGQDKYIKEAQDKKASLISQEVSGVAHELIRELLMSTNSKSADQHSINSSSHAPGSYVRAQHSNSMVTTATLESAFSEAIGALTETVIKQHADDGAICRTQSEIALRKLLRVLQEQYAPQHDEDARSQGSSAASVLGLDIANSVITAEQRLANQVEFGTDPKPKVGVTRSIQAMPETVDEQANRLLNQILTQLDIPSTETGSTKTEETKDFENTENYGEKLPSQTNLPGSGLQLNKKGSLMSSFENESDAATQISKALVQRLVPHLVEHFTPIPPKVQSVGTSSFKDFRKTGIYKEKFRPQDYTTSSQTELDTAPSSSNSEIDLPKNSRKLMSKMDHLAMNIVTDALKDDRVHNVRKADQIHTLVGELALGIVDTILSPASKTNLLNKKNIVGKQKVVKKVRTPVKKKRVQGPSSDKLLAKALDKARLGGQNKSGTITATPSGIEKLAEEIIDNVGRHSGSSRTSSGLSHDGSDVDILSYKLISKLPRNIEISPRSTSGSEILAARLVPNEVSMESSPRSEVDNFAEKLVEKSCKDGAEDVEFGVSASSSLAEFAISKSFVEGNYSKTTSESNMIDQMIKMATLDAVDIQSTKSSLASLVVRKSMIEGEEIALSKSPVSSVASDIVRNIEELRNSDMSTADELAEDILQHVLRDLPSNLNVKDMEDEKN